MQYQKVALNDSDWLVLDAVGDKYFILAESPLFRGYYSLQPCAYADSRLAAFLQDKYLPQMERGGVDISKITNLRIPSVGQYMLYIKDKLPPSKTPYLLQTQHPRQADCVLAIDENGEMIAAHVTDPCGIRPCAFVDKQYLNTLAGVDDLMPIDDHDEADVAVVAPVVVAATEPVSEKAEESAATPVVVPITQETGTADETEVPEVAEELEALEEYDEEYDIDEIVSLVGERELEEPEAEDIVSTIVTDERQTIEIKQVGDTTAVYLFDDEYSGYGIICDPDASEVQKIISAYGMTVQDFLSASNNTNRKAYAKDDVLDRIKRQQARWRWNH